MYVYFILFHNLLNIFICSPLHMPNVVNILVTCVMMYVKFVWIKSTEYIVSFCTAKIKNVCNI